MFEPVTPLQIFLALLAWLGIIFGVPLGCLLIYNCVSRGFFKRKKDPSQKQGGTESIRCLNCGANIDPGHQQCQKCGWTWN